MALITREINKVCRLCLTEDEVILFPAAKLIDSTLTVDDIERFTGVRIREQERLPYVVCIDCNNKLRKFIAYRAFCTSNDVRFRKWFAVTLSDDLSDPDRTSSSLKALIKEELTADQREASKRYSPIDDCNDQAFDSKQKVQEIEQGEQRIEDATALEGTDNIAIDDEDLGLEQVLLSDKLTPDPFETNNTLPSTHQSEQQRKQRRRVTASPAAKDKHATRDSQEQDSKKHVPAKQLCPLCGKLVHSMADHMLSHTKEPKFSCQHCPMTCSRKSYLKLHVDAVHKKRIIKSCEMCDKGFSYIESYEAHMRSKHNYGESFECTICNIKFRHKGGLRGHNNRKHNDQTNCSCDICGMKFQDKRGLRAHGRVHSDEKPFACQFCPKRFKSPNAHRTHELIHKGVVFPCTMCDKTYTYKSLLNMHVKKCHIKQEESAEN